MRTSRYRRGVVRWVIGDEGYEVGGDVNMSINGMDCMTLTESDICVGSLLLNSCVTGISLRNE